ncbi:MAG: pyridoxal-phosphate dependent enzyme [Chloroflexota bacterium]|nr:pyridoxal-phosphate dependent enzyme [Chloroflexota bacterium]
MTDRPTLDDVHAATERLRGIAVRTPVVPLHSYDASSDILLKLENLQPIGSFKLRGIFNAVAALTPERRAAGVSTTSSGNTAQALAWAGRYFGVTARSLMPEDAPVAKIEAMRAYGGTPVLVTREHLFSYMAEHGWNEEPYAFIHPWIDSLVMAGAGTIGLEILEDVPDVETIFIPVGGGGLSSGIGTAVKAMRPDIRIVAVEPDGCCALSQSLAAGKPMSDVTCNTICDGVAVPLVVPEVFEILRDVIDDVVLVSDDDVKKTIKRLALRNKLVTEGSGALAATAALSLPSAQRGKSVCIVTGGSIDPTFFASIVTDPTLD